MPTPARAGMLSHVTTPPPTRRSRPWAPSPAGPYTLPRPILDRLAVALAGFRNRDAAIGLAVFLARFWSSPARLALPFPIDRRALADHAALGLTEARVRGAIATLEAVGFLARPETLRGSRYRSTETGLRRKPIVYRFGAGFLEDFARANARGRMDRPAPARRPTITSSSARTPIARPVEPPAQLAQRQFEPERAMIMGDQDGLDSGLNAALERLRRAVGVCEG